MLTTFVLLCPELLQPHLLLLLLLLLEQQLLLIGIQLAPLHHQMTTPN